MEEKGNIATGQPCEVAPSLGPSSCLVSANEEREQKGKVKEGGGKRKRECSGEDGKVVLKEFRRNSKTIGGLRNNGAGLNRCHLPVKQLATESNSPRGRAKAGAGLCNELDRCRRLAFGPALGTRSMTRWRQASGSVAQHPNIPNIHYKHTNKKISTMTQTTTNISHTTNPISVHVQSKAQQAVGTQEHYMTKHGSYTRTQDKQAQDPQTFNKIRCTLPTQEAQEHLQDAHSSQTPVKSAGHVSPRHSIIPTKARKERFEEMYVKGELIGHGGYGSVYAGFRKSDNQPVALKFVDQWKIKMWAKMSDQEDALPLEIALLRQVCRSPRCEQVAQLLDYYWLPGPEGVGVYLLILEHPIPCMDLFNYMQEEKGYLEEEMARHVMQQVVTALLHCHSRGVVHRDLKPENILVQVPNHNVLLLDFGSASVLKDGAYTDVAGTPEYLPPETVLRGEYFAVPATVWSLGILLFQMVWGDVPFYSDASIAKGTLYFPRGISRYCRHLIRRCLAVCPDDRPTLEQIQEHPWMQ